MMPIQQFFLKRKPASLKSSLFLAAMLGLFLVAIYNLNSSLQQKYSVESRKEHVERVCQKYKSSKLFKPMTWKQKGRFFWTEDRRKFMYCYITKVANTNWKRALLFSRGEITDAEFERLAKKNNAWHPLNPSHFVQTKEFRVLFNFTEAVLSEMQYKDRMKTYFKFLFVRNPWVRLLSAYRDMYEYEKPEFVSQELYKVHGHRAIKMFRKNATEHDIQDGRNVKFVEFLQYIIYQHDNEEKFNMHYLPFYKMCNPCQVKFDFIGYYETLVDDARTVLERIGGKSVGLREFPSPSLSPSSVRSNHTTESVMSQFYSKIPKNILDRVYQVYKYDFELFGYPKSVPT